ncbi:MAG TPA: chemotaxis protein CheB, partial [Bryobacteraceae bacterium]|nr:chemotaxis protein CheB [Bryobacteraceae bacterium]
MAKKSRTREARPASGRRNPPKTRGAAKLAATATKRAKPAKAKIAQPGDLAEHFPVVGLGASAGGLEAFTQFLTALPANTGMGFVLIQHMDPHHESILASLLQRSTKMPIREATEGTVVEPNRVYISPPNSLMTISNGVLSLTTRGPRSFRDYPIDQFFVSLADDLKHRAIGVVLSGTASDGTRGLQAIKTEGGITFAQDTESAQFSSMPASAVASGCVDFALPPDRIAQELARINGHPYIRHAPASAEPPDVPAGTDGLRRILRQLRIASGVDFELYKPAMIVRRIARRMALHRIDSHDRYLELIKKDRAELDALYEDIFIHVTSFFRDPESLRILQKRVLVNFTPGKSSRTIRIWVPGCSSGEEVYSIAMLLIETLGQRRPAATIQIFGTDISERSVQRARAGIYGASSLIDVAPERQKRFFSRVEGGYQIVKSIRDVCVFARHDVTKDPPFSKLDLISCRNVLIYMGPVLQKKVVEAFHYALKPGGYLMLGKSESLTAYSSLFAPQDAKHKILARRPSEFPQHVHAPVREQSAAQKAPLELESSPAPADMRREAERLLLDRYTPAALVVDSNLQIIHFQGKAGYFLAPASGEPSFHLLRMIRPELLVDMRTAIYQAKREGVMVHREGIRFKHNGESTLVDIDVSPMKTRGHDQDYLVVFRDNPRLSPSEQAVEKPARAGKDRSRAELARSEHEIAALREQLQELVQNHEAADEEMRSMNEEILSSNEELQSTNEELETAKEELESTNEELTTLNDELQKRNTDLSILSDDLSNVLVAMDIPMVLLDAKLHIRRFTPAAGRVLNLIATDISRPLSDLASTLPSVNWKGLIAEVTEKAQYIESEVQDHNGHWYTLRMRPYYSSRGTREGVLIALQDVDLVKRSLEDAAEARERAQDLEARLALAGENLRIGMWELDIASGEVRGSKQWSELYGLKKNNPITQAEWMARVHPEDRPLLQDGVNHLITGGKALNREYRLIWPDRSVHWLNRRAELVRDAKGNPVKVRGVSIDITSQKMVEQERQAFASRISSAQEGERRRIARELHDGLIQELAGVAMDLGRRVTQPPASDELEQDYHLLQSRVVKAAEAARHVAYELHPTELDDLGLEKALRAYCQQIGQENGVSVEFASHRVPQELTRETALCLYKV